MTETVWEQHILELIRGTNDPQQRAQLTVMMEMTRALKGVVEANTVLATEVKLQKERFTDHEEKELELISQIRGMGRMFGWSVTGIGALLGVILGVGVWVFQSYVTTVISETATNVNQESRIAALEAKVEVVMRQHNLILDLPTTPMLPLPKVPKR